MKIHSQEEIEEIFRRLGLATEADRQRFQFEMPVSAEEKREEVQLFIRAQGTTVAEGGNRDAKLA
jgi:hypothetical protein